MINMTEQNMKCYTFKIYERNLCKTQQFFKKEKYGKIIKYHNDRCFLISTF